MRFRQLPPAGSPITPAECVAALRIREPARALIEGLRAIVGERGAPLDLIVCNPPYIEPSEADSLAPEVREYEPEVALFAPEGEPDHWALALLDAGQELLADDGSMLVELGHRQGTRVLDLAAERGWSARLHQDSAGIERVFEAQRA